MTKHKFSAGDKVAVDPTRANLHLRPGIYTITQVMPLTGSVCQYRAKNALDQHERVLDEPQLRAAS